MKKESTQIHPIGSYPTDFSGLCLDCMKRDEVSNYAHRQVYLEPDREADPIMVGYLTPGGSKSEVSVYPLIQHKYCYYHTQKRGLLSWQ